MSTEDEDTPYPRSVRHKQILDKAKAHPDASMDELASMVPSATAELVERTLDEYGDPATAEESGSPDGEDEQDIASGGVTEMTADSVGQTTADTDGGVSTDMSETNTTSADSTTESPAATGSGDPTDVDEEGQSAVDASVDAEADDSEHEDANDATGEGEHPAPTVETLSPKQREVLEYIAAEPTATQREIGDKLGVSSATINNRVNSIDGFEWDDRASFVDAVLEPESDVASETVETDDSRSLGEVESTLADIEGHLTALDERIERLEGRLDQEADAGERPASGFDDPELVHKVVHACVESERVSEEEELRLIQHALS